MELRNFTFEQMEDHGETVNVEGAAKAATVQIDTGDISLSGGVRISIESEDIIINTAELEWKDKEKTIKGGVEKEVDVKRSDGTTFTGKGFSADIRSRKWSFSGEVKGRYVEKDEEN
jgi:LPS export ABC transporter protein LptC